LVRIAMSTIFISYASQDRDTAERIARALEAQGWAVWWDRKIAPGKKYDEVIHKALGSAQCIVVLWSQHSVDSDWVKEEAEEGKERGILVPVVIGEAPVPLGFRRVQAANLVGWRGSFDDSEFQEFRASVARLVKANTFCVRDDQGSEWGPITESELRDWIKQRRVSAEMFIRQDGRREWRRIGDVPALRTLTQVAMTAPSAPKMPPRRVAAKAPPRLSDPPTHTSHTLTKGGFWLTRGSCGLAKQYWLFGVVYTSLSFLAFATIADSGFRRDSKPVEIIYFPALSVYLLLWTVGIWRATINRPKPDYWGIAAKIFAVVLLLYSCVITISRFG